MAKSSGGKVAPVVAKTQAKVNKPAPAGKGAIDKIVSKFTPKRKPEG